MENENNSVEETLQRIEESLKRIEKILEPQLIGFTPKSYTNDLIKENIDERHFY